MTWNKQGRATGSFSKIGRTTGSYTKMQKQTLIIEFRFPDGKGLKLQDGRILAFDQIFKAWTKI